MSGCEKNVVGPGWYISPHGYETLTQNGLIKDQRSIYQNALDSDLREIGAQVLSTEIAKSKIDELVLQIHKVRNIAAPKANEDSQAAPRMLKLTLTDGHSFCQGIEVESIQQISVDRTAPGAKILLKNAQIKSGYILLQPSCCTYLGGKVPALYEKWEVSRSLLKNNRRRASNPDGPPAWVNFGKKIASTDDASFKSLNNKDAPKHDTEFENQRKGAIAEVASGAVKKVFGGGVKKFSDAQAERDKQFNLREQQQRGFRDKRRHEGRGKIMEEAASNKPPEKVCLFNFLEDKLNDSQAVATPQRAFEKPPQRFEQQGFSFNKPQSSGNRYNNQNYNRESYNNQNYNRESYNNQQQSSTSYNRDSYHNQQRNNASYNNHQQNREAYNYQQRNNGTYNKESYNSQQPNNTFYHKRNVTNESTTSYNKNSVSNGSAETQSTAASAATTSDTNSVNSLTNNMGRMSVNSQFASRSLKQHLNLNKNKKDETVVVPKTTEWKIGEHCLAKYWEDGKFYNACITDITETTLVVLFTDYGNVEEVLKTDCKPQTAGKSYRPTQRYYSRKPFAGKPEASRKRPEKPA